MLKRAFFCMAVLCLTAPSPLFAGTLGPAAEQEIFDRLGDLHLSDVALDLNVRITVPDNPAAGIPGAELFATVLRPAVEAEPPYCEERPFGRPTIVIATPYRREVMLMLYMSLLNHDYNVLSLDVRGSGSSGGEWLSFAPEEHFDLGFVIDQFIPSQPWSDGTVGMIGPSYMGISQLLAAGQIESTDGIPTHLKALFPLVPMSDTYRDIVMHGGNLDLEFIPMWLGMVDVMAALPPLLFLGDDTAFSPTADELREATDIWEDHINNIPVTVNWILKKDNIDKNAFFDSKSTMIYWPDKPEGGWRFGDGYPADLGTTVIPAKLPVFMTGGWFDIFTRGTINTWEHGLKHHDPSDKSMIIGPWYHIDGSLGLGMNGLINGDIAGRWFDWKIKGLDDPFMEEYPVLLYILGEERWRAEKSWPLPETRTRASTLFLSKTKSDAVSGDWFSTMNGKNNYALVETPGKKDYYNAFWFFRWFYKAKENPVLKHRPLLLHGLVSRSSTRWLMGVPAILSQASKALLNMNIDHLMPFEDERLDEIGSLTFTTEPFEEDVEIAGPMTLTFWAETDFTAPLAQDQVDDLVAGMGNLGMDLGGVQHFIDKRDVQWVVEVNDVFPKGRARNVTSGWLSAENRAYDAEHPAEPDPAYRPFDPFYDRPFKEPSPILTGVPYKYVVEIWPTVNVFKKGHRLRISVSASDFPHLFPVFRPSDNTLVIDEEHPARLDFTRVTGRGDALWVDDPDDYVMSSIH
ncbi:CocE/NonD family hydrolase [Desulfatiferula olefinivorans]